MKTINNNVAPISTEPVTAPYVGKYPLPFDVRVGVPLGTAFDQLAVILESATEAIESVAMEDTEVTPTWSAHHNLVLAMALVQSMHAGYTQHRKAGQ